MKCGRCHRPTESTTNGLCPNCYVPDEERPDYHYSPRGQVEGTLINIPSATCATCGSGIHQPMPTGLWFHFDGWHLYDGEKAHIPQPASTLLELQDRNIQFMRESVYKKICYLHQKYWNIQLEKDNQLIDSCTGFNEQLRRTWYQDSPRDNIMGFRAYIEDNKRKYMTRIPSQPKLYLEYDLVHGRGFGNVHHEIIGEKLITDEETQIPNENDIIKVNGKSYKVINVGGFYRINAFRNEISISLRKK